MFNSTVLSRALYSPGELHWCKVNHLQTHLLNEDLSSEILALVTQHLLRFRKAFPKKSGISDNEAQIHRIHPTVCVFHFHSRIWPTYLYFHCVKCYWLLCVSTARVQTATGWTGSNWERKNPLHRTTTQWCKLHLLKFPFSALWLFTAWILAWNATSASWVGGNSLAIPVFRLKEHFRENRACFTFMDAPPKFLFGWYIRQSSLGLSKPNRKKKSISFIIQDPVLSITEGSIISVFLLWDLFWLLLHTFTLALS